MKKFKLHFLCAEQNEYNGDCVSVVAPLEDGYVGAVSYGVCFCKKSCRVERFVKTDAEKPG